MAGGGPTPRRWLRSPRLPAQWQRAVSEVDPDQLCDRPIPEMWSIAEYADHVREVLFAMRFLLDTQLFGGARQRTSGEPPPERVRS